VPGPGGPQTPWGGQWGHERDRRPATVPRTSPLAVAALLCAALGWWLFGLGSLAGIALGLVSLQQIQQSDGSLKGRGLAIAGLVLSAAWLVVAIVVVIAIGAGGATRSASTGKIVSRGHLPAFSLATGDCFNNPAGARSVSSVTAIPCTQPHNAQVYAEFKLTGSDFSYPGETAVVRLASEGCNARTGSVNKAKTTSAMTTRVLYPRENSWFVGRRTVSCLVVNPTADLTSSLLNSQPAG